MRKAELEVLMINVFRKIRSDAYIDLDSKIKEDLNLDSLELFSACIEIEERTKLEVCKYISSDIVTIGDLLEAITEKKDSKFDMDYSKYPKPKKMKDAIKFIKFLNKAYDIRISGIEKINAGNQIICPNHESNYDPFFVMAALYLNNISIEKFCCFASEDVWNSKMMRKAFVLLGAIPVFRTENSSLALKRAEEILNDSNDNKLLIHPEGRRTRDGKLGVFKSGAAKLSEDTRTEIIPVCINGTYEVWPYGKTLPKITGKPVIEVKFLDKVTDGDIMKVKDAIRIEKEKYLSK